MYNNETKDKFVELRAAGKSFGDISQELGVVKSTLHRWEDERADDIARLRRIAWEETEAEIGYRLEEQLSGLACDITDFQTILNGINRNKLSVRETLMLLRETRREYFRVRGILMGTSGSRSTRKTSPASPQGETQYPQHTEISNMRSEITSSAASVPPRLCVEGSNSNNTSESPSSQSAAPLSNSSEGVLRCPQGATTTSATWEGAEGMCGEQAVRPSAVGTAPVNHGLQRPVTEEQQRGSSKAPEESNETERFQQNAITEPHNTNDLQQSAPQSFDFSSAPPGSETSLNPQSPTLNQTENPTKTQPFPHRKNGGSTRDPEGENQTISGPLLDQKEGGSSSGVPFNRNLNFPERRAFAPSTVHTSATGDGSAAAPLSYPPSAETQNPAFYPPFIHQNEGGSPSAPLDPNATPSLDAETFIESTVVSPNECLRSVLEKCLQAEGAA
jgi:hypothetical protein